MALNDCQAAQAAHTCDLRICYSRYVCLRTQSGPARAARAWPAPAAHETKLLCADKRECSIAVLRDTENTSWEFAR